MTRLVMASLLLVSSGGLFYVAWLGMTTGDSNAYFFLAAGLFLALPVVPLLVEFRRRSDRNADSGTSVRFVPHVALLRIMLLIMLGFLLAVFLPL